MPVPGQFFEHTRRYFRQVVKMAQAGVSPKRRFSFYDQVRVLDWHLNILEPADSASPQIHTTGMDIPQYYTARACVTLGKDMTWRDLAQVLQLAGAFPCERSTLGRDILADARVPACPHPHGFVSSSEQGAFRMRSIGQGQTISMLITSQVFALIQRNLARAKQVPLTQVQMGSPTGDAASRARLLCSIASWLFLNSMKSERVQVCCAPAEKLPLSQRASLPLGISSVALLSLLPDGHASHPVHKKYLEEAGVPAPAQLLGRPRRPEFLAGAHKLCGAQHHPAEGDVSQQNQGKRLAIQAP